MALLDELFFPHIRDLILANLDFPGCVVAPQVSKHWREKANKVLQRHVEEKPKTGGLLLTPKTFNYPEVRVPRYLLSQNVVYAFVILLG